MRTFLLLCILFPFVLTAQQGMEENLDIAYQNAKKGIYWALSNIPENKQRLQSDLIADEKLYASVKLIKEFNGIKIVSKGIYNTVEVSVTIYRSVDGLIQDGYLTPPSPEEKKEE
ncbi:MAG TPA: hypothetical protein VKD08_17120 [Ignavibacteriaceae bacterium]|jgi:hypothetical protein|nr:hypothetical protein [Ignavibacteriaceae bacterium]